MQVKELKKGDYFTRKSLGEKSAKPSQVYIRGDFDQSEKKYLCSKWDDISKSIMLKGDTEVYQNFIF